MTPKQEEALRDYLQEVITPLIEQVLVKKLGQAMTFAKEELIQPKRTWAGLTDKEIEKCWQASIKLDNGKGADITNQPFYFLAKIVEEELMGKNK